MTESQPNTPALSSFTLIKANVHPITGEELFILNATSGLDDITLTATEVAKILAPFRGQEKNFAGYINEINKRARHKVSRMRDNEFYALKNLYLEDCLPKPRAKTGLPN